MNTEYLLPWSFSGHLNDFLEPSMKEIWYSRSSSSNSIISPTYHWLSYTAAIPVFAAYCPKSCHLHLNLLLVEKFFQEQYQLPYLDLQLEINNGWRLITKLYHKHDDFTFPIVNFLFISSNIPSSSAYGVYISQHIRYSMVCAQYNDFLDRVQRLTKKLLIAETCRAL